jgi:hypothetical protein
MTKEQVTLLCKMVFNYWELYKKRLDLFVKDDIWQCIAFSKNCWWQVDEYSSECNIEQVVRWLQDIKYNYNEFWYSKEKVQELLNEPWQEVQNLIDLLYNFEK